MNVSLFHLLFRRIYIFLICEIQKLMLNESFVTSVLLNEKNICGPKNVVKTESKTQIIKFNNLTL